MVLDSLVLLYGLRSWGRALRAHGPDAPLGFIPAAILRDHPSRHGSPSSKLLGSRSCGHYRLPSVVARARMEREKGSSLPIHRACFVSSHARLEHLLLYPRDAFISEGAS